MLIGFDFCFSAGNWPNPAPSQQTKNYFKNWRKSINVPSYVSKNATKVSFVTLYFLLNAALFIWVGISRKDEGGWVIIARTHGMCLNFNSAFILVLMLKSSLTWLRSTRIGSYFPIDDYIDFHKAVGIVIFVQSVMHFIGHLGRYSKI